MDRTGSIAASSSLQQATTAIAILLCLTACGEKPEDTQRAAPSAKGLVTVPCPDDRSPDDLRCAKLSVPEDPGNPEGRQIDLNIAVVPALNPGAEPAALFVLEGGPGVAATAGAEFFLDEGAAYRERHDVVMVDLRGTGGSSPLHCPALEGVGVPLQRHLDEMYPPTEVKDCRDRLETVADLRQYTTSSAVEDVEAVRRALGYAKLDLQALSYGTRLATEYMRRYPQHVRTLTAIGALPPSHRVPLHHAANFQRAFDLLLADCEADAACRDHFPDLRERWAMLLERMAQPVVYRYEKAELDGGGIDLVIRRDVFVEELRSAMYEATKARSLPLVVDAAFRGDYAPFLELALPADADAPSFIAEGAYLSVTCTEDISRIAAADIALFTDGTYLGDYRIAQQLRACELWPSGLHPDAMADPVVADIPALLITGELDPVTPPSDAERVARSLPNSRVVIVPNAGHLPFDLSDPQCIDRVMVAFLHRGSVEGLALGCIDALEPPPFELN